MTRRVTFLRVRLGTAQEADERALNAFIAEVKIKKIVPVLVQNALPNFWSIYVEYEENKKELESKEDALQGRELELPRSKGLESIRHRYPKAYERWTKHDDTSLKREYSKGLSIEQLSEMFQRHPGAIRSRLQKLGLVGQEFEA